MKYKLELFDDAGNSVSIRKFNWHFDHAFERDSDEEYMVNIKAREMYRDAAFVAGKRALDK